METLALDRGKYLIVSDKENGQPVFKCLRHGEPWRDLIGDNLIYFLFHAAREKKPEKRAMADAPRDGFQEILAFHIVGKNYHPVYWNKEKEHWTCRWNREYHTSDRFYDHWVEYPHAEI